MKIYKRRSDLILPVHSDGLQTNLSGAVTFCEDLGFSKNEINEGLSRISQIPHKLEVKKFSENYVLVDDAYSSNEQGFYNALALLETFKDFKKVLVTPGIVELGDESVSIHEKLSVRIAQVCDFVLFVGLNERTKALASSLRTFKYINSVFDYQNEVKGLKYEKVVVLLENDLPQNY